jgi:DNA-binding transcriptional ArsR family regulator
MLQLSQRPLTASDADMDLFVDREAEISGTLRSLALGLNVLILGSRGSGRTSLLRRLSRDINDAENLPSAVYVDGSAWPGPSDLVSAIRAALGEDLRGEPRWDVVPKVSVLGSLVGGGYERVPNPRPPVLDESDVRGMAAAEDTPTIVLVDGASPQAAHTIFGRFRDTLWEFPHRWVVTGDVDKGTQYLKPPADVFFETLIDLPDLSPGSAHELLQRRVQAASSDPDAGRLQPVLTQLVESVPTRTPRNLLTAARLTLLSGRGASAAIDAVAARQQRAAALGRPAAMLYAELEGLGPVHAGDERLLDRLGYTRPRVVQLLKELEAEGLVESRSEGRRRIYSIPATGGVR